MVAYITELNEQNYDSFVEKGIVLVDIKIYISFNNDVKILFLYKILIIIELLLL